MQKDRWLLLNHQPIFYTTLLSSIAEWVRTKRENPSLTFGTDYHFRDLSELTGELHIIGLSPNNDSHIFRLIEGSGIDRIVYYYFSDSDKDVKVTKEILDQVQIPIDKDWSVTNLAGKTMEYLKLMPENIPDSAPASKSMKALLGNLLQVATRMAELRNPYGSGHGKSATYKGLEERHAKLAVGASITFVSFLWDTFEKRGTM